MGVSKRLKAESESKRCCRFGEDESERERSVTRARERERSVIAFVKTRERFCSNLTQNYSGWVSG